MNKKLKILILEDVASDVELIQLELKKANIAFSAKCMETKEAFLKELKEFAPDIILSDYMMPHFNGMEALQLAKERARSIPFVIVTGSMNEETAVECIKAGAWDYVIKEHLSRLGPTVMGALEKKRGREEKKRMEEKLKESEQRHRTLVETIPHGIEETDTNGNFVFANSALHEIYDYDKGELIGKSIFDLVPTELEQKRFREFVAALVKEKPPPMPYEARKLTKKGSVIDVRVDWNYKLDKQGEIAGFISVITEITARKQAELALKKIEEQLRTSQKMEGIGRLAGGIAHDFNNLLTEINGYSELTLNHLPKETPLVLRKNIEEIKKAGDRAASLTHQLLAFSRKQVLQPKILNLNHVVTNLNKMLRRLIGEDVELITVTHPGLGAVKADPGQLEQIIMNLVVNSRDALSNGGKITIETSNVELNETNSSGPMIVKPGSYMLLTVSDNGCGMNQYTREHLFEPFFTTKNKGKGTGLGLSTVYGIVKQSGGYIWADSDLGQGAAFKIFLPEVKEEVKAPESGQIEYHDLSGTETILIVEDEAGVRELASQILEDKGYHILEARHSSEAIEIGQRYKGPIQLMLTDMIMPGLNGTELAKRLSSIRPEINVLYMSGYTDEAIVRHGVRETGISFLQKPFTTDGLALKVREVLDRSKNRNLGNKRLKTAG